MQSTKFEGRTRRSHGNMWTIMWWFSKCLHHKMSMWTLEAHWEASALSSRGCIMVSPSCLLRAAHTVRKATEDSQTPEFNLWDHSATWKIQVQLNQREALKPDFGAKRGILTISTLMTLLLQVKSQKHYWCLRSASAVDCRKITFQALFSSFCSSALSCTSGPLCSPLIV